MSISARIAARPVAKIPSGGSTMSGTTGTLITVGLAAHRPRQMSGGPMFGKRVALGGLAPLVWP